MKNAPKIGLGIAAGAGAAALTYGGFAMTNWLRYGRRPALPVTTLAQFIAEPEVSERHRLIVDALPENVFNVACNLETEDSKIARLLFATRAFFMGAKNAKPALPRPLVEQFKAIGWTVLAETPGHEIVFGAVCKPWEGDVTFRPVPAEEVAAFAEPGFTKIAWGITVDRVGGLRTLIRTETRVSTTDEESRRRFRRYWAFVAPGVGLVRRELLRMIKRQAEKSA